MLKQLHSLCYMMQPGFVFIRNDKIQDRDNNFYRKSIFFQFGERTPVPRAPRKDQGQSGGRRRKGNLSKAFVLLLREEQGRQS